MPWGSLRPARRCEIHPGVPWNSMDVRSLNPPYLPESDANAAPVRGDYAAGGRGGEENPRPGEEQGYWQLYCQIRSIAVVSGTISCPGQRQCPWHGTLTR